METLPHPRRALYVGQFGEAFNSVGVNNRDNGSGAIENPNKFQGTGL